MDTKKATDKLLAISILDGRNRDKLEDVTTYFSEYALIKYRLKIEIAYLIFLAENTKILRKITSSGKKYLQKIWDNFTPGEALIVKEIEAKINHDVKAVEYYLQGKLKKTTLQDVVSFIHFGLTSYDINTPAYGLMLLDFRKDVLIPKIDLVQAKLRQLIENCRGMIMLGRTHGQPALPTTMSKELAIYYKRVKTEVEILRQLPIEAKLTGAIGNFNALKFVVPEIDWFKFSKKFILSLGLQPNLFTTQIMPYESWLRIFDSLKRLNNILIGLCQDIWWYISFEYFLQKKKEAEVGSSTMAHKINPITFENAEGNLQFANSMFEFFTRKLAVSRLQRDLSDSTVKRDFGLAFGFTLLAWDSLLVGLSRISPNTVKMQADLDAHWEIFSEGIQIYLRYKGYHHAFELLKEKTRGKVFSKEELHSLINTLPLKGEDKKRLKIKSLKEYGGLAEELVDLALAV